MLRISGLWLCVPDHGPVGLSLPHHAIRVPRGTESVVPGARRPGGLAVGPRIVPRGTDAATGFGSAIGFWNLRATGCSTWNGRVRGSYSAVGPERNRVPRGTEPGARLRQDGPGQTFHVERIQNPPSSTHTHPGCSTWNGIPEIPPTPAPGPPQPIGAPKKKRAEHLSAPPVQSRFALKLVFSSRRRRWPRSPLRTRGRLPARRAPGGTDRSRSTSSRHRPRPSPRGE